MKSQRILSLLILLVILLIAREFILREMDEAAPRFEVTEVQENGSAGISASIAGSTSGTITSQEHSSQALETLTGQVLALDTVMLRHGLSRGLQLMLETDEEIIPVYLGPHWRLESETLRLRPKEQVKVSGLRTHFDGFEMFIVAEITSGGKTLRVMEKPALRAWQRLSSNLFNLAAYYTDK